MITKRVLRELVVARRKDAKALFEKRRYSGAVYMAGYAIEIALKYNICKMYLFVKGFPESKSELQSYPLTKSRKFLANTITSLSHIRNHDLHLLLKHSGFEFHIMSLYQNEWNLISNWRPDMRYRVRTMRKSEANINLTAVDTILKEII